MSDPFSILGLQHDATAADVRAARRELARRHHPDAGGDADAMRRLNVAAADALRILATPEQPTPQAPSSDAPPTHVETTRDADEWTPSARDVPSFTVEALPVETFEALLLACAELGEVEDDDPPYVLRCLLAEPIACWCQLDIVPDAGASTVSVAIARIEQRPLPRCCRFAMPGSRR